MQGKPEEEVPLLLRQFPCTGGDGIGGGGKLTCLSEDFFVGYASGLAVVASVVLIRNTLRLFWRIVGAD
jgi:hypothetical protein